MGKVTWSEKDMDILKQYYENKGSEYCLKLMSSKRKLKTISKKARELGLRKNKTWSVEEDSKLRNLWQTLKTSEIAENFNGRSYAAVLSRALYLGLRVKDKGFKRRKGSLSFLDTLTDETSYWWGLILSDGHLSKKGELVISLKEDDSEYLSNLSSKLNVNLRVNKNKKLFTVGDKHFVEKWRYILKISDSCTKTYCPPDISIFKNHLIPLLIGIIDGDGHIRYSDGHYSCYIEMYNTWDVILIKMKEELEVRGIQSKIEYTKQNRYCRMKIVGKDNMLKLSLYIQNLPYMKRKWDKILQSQ